MLRKAIMNRTGLRNILIILGQIDNYTTAPGNFIPYFTYELGESKDDFKLYFRKLPDAARYYNYIFLKLWSYKPHDAIKYLEYHYDRFPDKKDFLLFVQRDLKLRTHSLKNTRFNKTWEGITEICLEWMETQLQENRETQKLQVYNQFIRNDLTVIIKNELKSPPPPSIVVNNEIQNSPPSANGESIYQLTDTICNSLQTKLNSIVEDTEGKISSLADKYETGDIQLANLHFKDKLITLFLCLKNLASKPTRKNKSGDLLFAKMDLNDIAQILRLHFAAYQGRKIDSIEKRIYEVNNNLTTEAPAYQDLSKALQKFFF